MSKVGLVMGSKNDFDVVEPAVELLKSFGVECDVMVSSAHRTPERTAEWSRTAEERGLDCIIAYAGAAAHLAGVIAADTNLPVIAVPVSATTLGGFDALLSMVQMPGGIPVATMAIGKAGSKNAALLACQIIARREPSMRVKLAEYREDMKAKVIRDHEDLLAKLK